MRFIDKLKTGLAALAGECIKFVCSLRRTNLAFFAVDLPTISQKKHSEKWG